MDKRFLKVKSFVVMSAIAMSAVLVSCNEEAKEEETVTEEAPAGAEEAEAPVEEATEEAVDTTVADTVAVVEEAPVEEAAPVETAVVEEVKKEEPKEVVKEAVVEKVEEVAQEAFPNMVFEVKEYEFGTINQGDKVNRTFKFTNTGDAPLIISNARASCGCTVPKWPKEPINPGDTGEIDVTFNSRGKRGRQTKSITITANTERKSEVVYLKGMVEVPPVETETAE